MRYVSILYSTLLYCDLKRQMGISISRLAVKGTSTTLFQIAMVSGKSVAYNCSESACLMTGIDKSICDYHVLSASGCKDNDLCNIFRGKRLDASNQS